MIKRLLKEQSGFTLIEMLIVVIFARDLSHADYPPDQCLNR